MSVQVIYRLIIDDVIRKIKDPDMGLNLDDNVIEELQTMWEARLENSGAIPHTIGHGETSVLNPNNNNNNIINPNNNNNSSITNINSVQQYQNLQLPNPNNIPRPNESELTRNGIHPVGVRHPSEITTTAGRPTGFVPTFKEIPNNNNYYNNLTNLNPTSPISSASLRSIMNPIPQNDGVNDEEEEINVNSDKQDIDKFLLKSIKTEQNFIVQMDGNDDEDDEDFEENKDQNQDDDLLNSDLDDDDDDEDPDPVIEHYVLCQYEKVTRIKAKRKCVFKDGVMHLNGKDSLFNKANGEFIWI
ncbi:transcription factor IIA [Tieghemostelium lacteum]|uniref:Transcription factor IIA n=1 Tax=Tieghemostelium lacteum TaxID=361077 RepID=A0A151ZIT0_TIELA|nr:transcription factor IIA [Tieghemostelium lacteum]|eukprot:KYQ93790.1 transcription factor IIA [Tieghemostelium lacteum]